MITANKLRGVVRLFHRHVIEPMAIGGGAGLLAVGIAYLIVKAIR